MAYAATFSVVIEEGDPHKRLFCVMAGLRDTLRLGTWQIGAEVSGHRWIQQNDKGPLVLRCERCGRTTKDELRAVEE